MSRLDDAITNARYIVDCLNALKCIIELPCCNQCKAQKTCQYAPEIGKAVRYNCPHFVGINGKEYESR